ncbi:MAG: hypothetical protein IPI23_13700 [Bacteroidetes bacterium]|nr:hypothetical protein [Bacteroidota bacterium]MBL0072421.1 hypothetical protein [Bacteroidota bacterium]
MNKLIYIIILLLTGRIGYAQNLVPNPSFEDTINCPFSVNQFAYCDHWNKYRETPDYFY